MKKLLVHMTIFSPVAAIVYIIMLYASETVLPSQFKKNLPFETKFELQRLEHISEYPDLDILFVGSSRVFQGIDPSIFKSRGLNILAMGTPHQTPKAAQLLLAKYLTKLNPDRVVFELAPGSFDIDYQHEVAAILAAGRINYESLKMALEVNNMITYNTLLLKSILQVLTPETEDLEKVKNFEYLTQDYFRRSLGKYSIEDQVTLKKQIAIEQIESVQAIINGLDDAGIKYTFIQIPVAKTLYNSIANKNEFDSLISTFGSYHNFNESMNLVDTIHFEDGSHLNQFGVEMFNPVLIEYLESPSNWTN